MMKRFLPITVAVLLMIMAVACSMPEGDCGSYCDQAQECANVLDQMFSYSACSRDCNDNDERHASVDCETEFKMYLECISSLSCNDFGEQGEKCSTEVDILNQCVDDNT